MSIRHWIILDTLSILTWLGTSASPAWAELKQSDFTLNSYGNQTFESLMHQAESLAQTSIEQEFADNPSLTEVFVTIMGERNGQKVPLLSSKVSRSNWHKQPTIQHSTRYFSSSKILLGFFKTQVPQSALLLNSTYDDGRGFDGEKD